LARFPSIAGWLRGPVAINSFSREQDESVKSYHPRSHAHSDSPGVSRLKTPILCSTHNINAIPHVQFAHVLCYSTCKYILEICEIVTPACESVEKHVCKAMSSGKAAHAWVPNSPSITEAHVPYSHKGGMPTAHRWPRISRAWHGRTGEQISYPQQQKDGMQRQELGTKHDMGTTKQRCPNIQALFKRFLATLSSLQIPATASIDEIGNLLNLMREEVVMCRVKRGHRS